MTALAVRSDGIYVDGTFGRGGHSRAILERLGPAGRLIGIDRDPDALIVGRELEAADQRFTMIQAPFGRFGAVLDPLGVQQVDGLLLDLGVSSPQLDTAERGFAFNKAGPLDMRMDPRVGESAAVWLARATQDEIQQVLLEFGEERFAKRIARAILAARTLAPIGTTQDLVALIERAVPRREPGKHPATRAFQALRIQVNDELGELRRCLEQVGERLAAAGRLVVISFHSLEDRIVKRFVRNETEGARWPKGVPVTADEDDRGRGRWRAVGKALRPGAVELARNPRARSAVMRVAERLP